ncbi:unnamed protein product [Rhodiola kirilowii]
MLQLKKISALLANKSGLLTCGSGKVLDSGLDDNTFIYYSDHGSDGLVGMPTGKMKAEEFIDVLKKKHEARSYAQIVIYMEACYVESMFENLLPEDWNIYVTTASNSKELISWAFHYPKKESTMAFVWVTITVTLGWKTSLYVSFDFM